jgi:hypothetical protein
MMEWGLKAFRRVASMPNENHGAVTLGDAGEIYTPPTPIPPKLVNRRAKLTRSYLSEARTDWPR